MPVTPAGRRPQSFTPPEVIAMPTRPYSYPYPQGRRA